MSDNYIEFKFNNDNSIRCNVFYNGKTMIINNQNKCRDLFRIAKGRFNYKETKDAVVFENADKIIEIYKRICQKKEYNNLKINKERVEKIRRFKIFKKNMFRMAIVAGTSLAIVGWRMNVSSKADDNTVNSMVTNNLNKSKHSETNEVDVIYNEDSTFDYQIENDIDNYTWVNESEDYYQENMEQNVEINIDDNSVNDIVTFCFDGDDLGERAEFKSSQNYESIFEKYGKTYGVDSNLLMAIAAQEGSGVHKEYSENGHALGIMQVEMAIWCGNELTAYNFDTGMEETITVNKSDLSGVDYNIKVGAMIFQNVLEQYDYNIPLALQAYNFGAGNIEKMLNTCAYSTGVSAEEMINDMTHTEWMNYRNFLGVGDGEYVEHVLENLEDGKELVVTRRDSTEVKIKIDNTGIKNKTR